MLRDDRGANTTGIEKHTGDQSGKDQSGNYSDEGDQTYADASRGFAAVAVEKDQLSGPDEGVQQAPFECEFFHAADASESGPESCGGQAATLFETEHQVGVLHSLTGCAFEQVVDAADDDGLMFTDDGNADVTPVATFDPLCRR